MRRDVQKHDEAVGVRLVDQHMLINLVVAALSGFERLGCSWRPPIWAGGLYVRYRILRHRKRSLAQRAVDERVQLIWRDREPHMQRVIHPRDVVGPDLRRTLR